MAGIYIHIPFCVKKCAYCDFVSFPCPERMGEYVDALIHEIQLTAGTLPPSQPVKKAPLGFGGRSPRRFRSGCGDLFAATDCPVTGGFPVLLAAREPKGSRQEAVPLSKNRVFRQSLTAGTLPPSSAFDTVFFGGGTPSLLSGDQLARIMETLHNAFSIAPDAEISMECNPGTVTRDNLSVYRRAGVNRLSLGMQSMDAGCLKAIGRIHTPEQFLEAVRLAKDCGFQNINADVMHGLPGQTMESYLETLRIATNLSLTHLSSYALILEEGTPLYRSVQSGTIALPDPDLVADMEDAGMDVLEQQGFHRYEISNFAKDGFACRHNLNYWQNGEYLGFGPAAHACRRIDGVWRRFANTENLDTYCRLLTKNKLPRAESLALTKKEELFETVMLGLRLVSGIDTNAFYRRFGLSFYEVYPDAVDALRKRGWCQETGGSFQLNRKGLDMDNAAILLFMD